MYVTVDRSFTPSGGARTYMQVGDDEEPARKPLLPLLMALAAGGGTYAALGHGSKNKSLTSHLFIFLASFGAGALAYRIANARR